MTQEQEHNTKDLERSLNYSFLTTSTIVVSTLSRLKHKIGAQITQSNPHLEIVGRVIRVPEHISEPVVIEYFPNGEFQGAKIEYEIVEYMNDIILGYIACIYHNCVQYSKNRYSNYHFQISFEIKYYKEASLKFKRQLLHAQLWDAIGEVVGASGGDRGNTSIARQKAVVEVEKTLQALIDYHMPIS